MPLLDTNNGINSSFIQLDYTNGEWRRMDGMFNLLNRGFLYGDGFFDTVAIFNSTPQFWEEHVAKIRDTSYALLLDLPHNWQGALFQLVKSIFQEGILRIYIFRKGEFGDSTTRESNMIVHFEDRELPTKNQLYKTIFSTQRVDSRSLLFRYKTLNRLPYLRSIQDLHGSGCTDAILLNEMDNLASLTSACILFGQDNKTFYIPTSEGTQAGAAIAKFCKLWKGTQISKRALAVSDLNSVGWILGLNSLGPRFIQQIDNITLDYPNEQVVETLKEMYPFLNHYPSSDSFYGIGLSKG